MAGGEGWACCGGAFVGFLGFLGVVGELAVLGSFRLGWVG